MATNQPPAFGDEYGVIEGPPVAVEPPPNYQNPPEEEGDEQGSITPPFFPMPGIGGNNIDYDQYEPATREVSEDELVENRLTDLLNSDNPFIQQARRRGERAAAERGAMSSSVFAGSSEASAIESALPIAQQDAQTYFRTASENMAAKNNMSLAKLQSATSIAQSNISASATLGSATISANAQMAMKQMDNDIRKDLFQLGAEHDTFMEQLRQTGRVELSELNFYQQRELEQMGFENSVDLSELNHQQRMEIEETFGDPRFHANLDLQRLQSQSNLLMQMSSMYSNGINNMNMMDIDSNAFERGESFYSDMFNFMFQLNDQMWGNSFPDIDIPESDSGGG